jgi:hypothetical protein
MNLSLLRRPSRPHYPESRSAIRRSVAPQLDYFPQLDGFRGLAAGLVVLGHLILFRTGSDTIARPRSHAFFCFERIPHHEPFGQ